MSDEGVAKTRWVEVATGTLERNSKKESDKQPDYKGKLKLSVTPELLEKMREGDEPVKAFISGWQKEEVSNGEEYKFMSLSVSFPFEEEAQEAVAKTAVAF